MSSNLNVTIEQHWIQSFSDTVYELTTQTMAKLRPVVEMEPLIGENKFFDRVGSAEVQNLNNRSPQIVPADLLWDRRKLTATRVGLAFFIDQRDIERVLTDPKSEYARRAAQSLERDLDRTIIAAFNSNVFTGKDGTTSVSAATDGVQTVDATAGFTYDTLLQLDENFQAYEIGTESPLQKFLIISEQEHASLMKEAELINRDFTDRSVVDNGKLSRVMDFNVITFGSKVQPTPMLSVASSQRTCFAVAAGCVKVGMPKMWDIKWQPRNDRWDTDQLLARGERGAVRMEGIRIQQITTTAT